MQQFWINLPVKGISRAKAFYTAIGFTPNPMHQNAEHLASFFIGDQKIVMMLFLENEFRNFTQNEVADTSKGTEILMNLDAESRDAVDKMAAKVKEAGGTIYAEPAEAQGWMYVCGFIDPDGHRWSILHMDMSKAPGQ